MPPVCVYAPVAVSWLEAASVTMPALRNGPGVVTLRPLSSVRSPAPRFAAKTSSASWSTCGKPLT